MARQVPLLLLLFGPLLVSANSSAARTRSQNSLTLEKNGLAGCKGLPATPINAQVVCFSASCVVTCLGNSKFPNDRGSLIIVCRDKQYVQRSKKPMPPECVSQCNPPCDKGRICFVDNHCGCVDNMGGKNCDEPKTCPHGQVYRTCANSCTMTCEASRTKPCTKKCVEGCTCSNEGFTKNAKGECVPVTKCPCVVGGVEYPEGHFKVQPKGNTHEACTCSSQQWTCKPITKGTASMSGDPHYTSIDGRRFDFMGRCGYTLLQHKNFTVEGENLACAGTAQGIQFFNDDVNKPTCTKSITIRLPTVTAHLLQGRQVLINGRKIAKFPFNMYGVKCFTASSNYVIAQFADGVEVQWDGSTMAHITVPEIYFGEVKGLLGYYNNNPNDDQIKSDGSIAKSVEEMGNSWKVDESCRNVKPLPHPCTFVPDKRELIDKECAVLRGPVFQPCHAAVNPDTYYDDCRYDLCQGQSDGKCTCICPILANYVHQCKLKGVSINWRPSVPACAIQCPAGQVYQTCINPCQLTCSSLSQDPTCKSTSCVEGCACPPNQVLDHTGRCVPPTQCGCAYEGVEHSHGYVLIRPVGNHGAAERCTCNSGKWVCTPQAGAACYGSGDPHYTTFDRRKFDFMGRETYYLLKLDKQLIVEAKNLGCFGPPSCTNYLTVRWPGFKINLLQGRAVTVNNQNVGVPYQKNGIRIYLTGVNVAVTLPNFVTLSWSGRWDFNLLVPGLLFGKTKGLCGTFNGNPNDDFTTPWGAVVPHPVNFGNSWKTNDMGLDAVFQPHPCERNPHLAPRADAVCNILRGQLFAKCHPLVKPDTAYDNCRYDVCACTDADSNKCACPIFAGYATQCAEQHVPVEWRNSVQSCQIPCPAGQTYQACGEACGRTCADLAATACVSKECAEGCNCPKGQSIDAQGKCVPKTECPCIHNKVDYTHGQQISRDIGKGKFERCTCVKARWECEPQKTAICSALGDPHYTTFDGKKYDFMGRCSYYLVYHPTFSIIVDNEQCGGEASCTKSVKISLRKVELKLLRNFEITFNANPVKSLPFENPLFTVRKASDSLVIVTLQNGVEVRWDGNMAVHVEAPATLYGQTQGLCGTFDGNIEDEWLTPEETQAKTAHEFGDSWKSNNKCGKSPPAPKACENNPNSKPKAEAFCNQLKGNVFSACHSSVGVTSFADDCIYDYCVAKPNNENEAGCRAMNSYAAACARHDVQLTDWRKKIPECGITCPTGQVYGTCGSSCGRTCKDIGTTCIDKCVDGCNCPEGQTLDREGGKCIPIAKCHCVYEGREYESDKSIIRPRKPENGENGVELCTCVNAAWVCTEQKGSRCTVLDAKHISTFDGHKYDVPSPECPMELLRFDKLIVTSEPCEKKDINGKCPRPLQIIFDKIEVFLQSSKVAIFNDFKVTTFPYEQRGVSIRTASTEFLVVKINNGIEIWWDGASRVYLDVPGNMFEHTQGLCGNFNSNPSDDLMTRDGDVTKDVGEFVESWSQNDKCIPSDQGEVICDPKVRAIANKHCDFLNGDIFNECSVQIPVKPFYGDCIADVCQCKGKAECMCDAIALYADECANVDIIVNWRAKTKECAVKCPAGQQYQACGDSCKSSCRILQQQQGKCETKCVPGCNCPEGHTLDDEGNCIALEDCPCLHEGRKYQQGGTVTRKEGDATKLCTCVEGAWTCKEQKSARCTILNNRHVTTFGGRLVDVKETTCAYNLLKTDGISVFSDPVCKKENECVTNVVVELASLETITFNKDSGVSLNSRPTTLPVTREEFSVIEESSTSVLLKMKSGMELRWNKADKIVIEVPPSFLYKTQGLCSTFTNDRQDELVKRDGKAATEVDDFVKSWLLGNCNAVKPKLPVETTCKQNEKLRPAAEQRCHILEQVAFAACREVVPVKLFLSMCLREACECATTGKCICDMIDTYAEECALNDIVVDWRHLAPQCGIQCPADQEFKTCGNACIHTCAAIAADNTCDAERCAEGCTCKAGHSLNAAGKCIPIAACPCQHEGKEHKPEDKITRSDGKITQHCVCRGGRWKCEEASPGICTNIGLTHYTTFDGTTFNFKANCAYYLMRAEEFAVQIELHACDKTKKTNTLGDRNSKNPTCAKTITIRAGNVGIKLGQEGNVLIDDNVRTKFPVDVRGVTVRRAANNIIVENKKGIEVWWDGENKVRIIVPASYEDDTQGLCGTFNRNGDDDFTTTGGVVTKNVQTFVDSWRVSQECNDKPEVDDPCDRDPNKKRKALETCSVLKSRTFQACHSKVEVSAFVEICMFESCSYDANKKSACSVFKTYSELCASNGVSVPWTDTVTECAERCPAGQVYNTCANSCGVSCGDRGLQNCSTKCFEGCTCREGQAFDADGKCIQVTQCPCESNNKQYNNGKQEFKKIGDKIKQCLCDAGKWDCQDATVDDLITLLSNR